MRSFFLQPAHQTGGLDRSDLPNHIKKTLTENCDVDLTQCIASLGY